MAKKQYSRRTAAVRLVGIKLEDAGEIARNVEVKVHPYFFEGREGELSWEEIKEFEQFTYGYALTVHKAWRLAVAECDPVRSVERVPGRRRGGHFIRASRGLPSG